MICSASHFKFHRRHHHNRHGFRQQRFSSNLARTKENQWFSNVTYVKLLISAGSKEHHHAQLTSSTLETSILRPLRRRFNLRWKSLLRYPDALILRKLTQISSRDERRKEERRGWGRAVNCSLYSNVYVPEISLLLAYLLLDHVVIRLQNTSVAVTQEWTIWTSAKRVRVSITNWPLSRSRSV